MDGDGLGAACEQVLRRVRSDPAYAHTSHLLVQVAGAVVVDEHLRGPQVADVFSVTKTVLATLVGIAVRRGHVPALTSPVTQVLPELLDTPVRRHTWEHLLTMTRGCATDGPYDVDEVTAIDSGQLRRIAEAPQEAPPGAEFRYDNGASHLLATSLDRVLPVPLADFADEALLAPLGVRDRHWLTDADGIPWGFGHLSVSADALARLGHLWLRGGATGDDQFVDPGFWSALTTATSPGGPPEELPYGYLCWLDGDGLLAGGWAGQHVLVRPRADAVVVVTGDPGFRFGPPPSDDLPQGWRPALDLVRAHVLPVLEPASAG